MTGPICAAEPVRRGSGYADGLISGATWGLVAVLLTTVSAALWGYPIVATTRGCPESRGTSVAAR
jgi:hypothetical protein